MTGYLIHHHSKLWDGVRADLYRNDPYVWAAPYLWSFCHTNQRPRVEPGMTVLWISKDDENRFVCDLVFVVAEALSFTTGLERFLRTDRGIALDHFLPGIKYHYEYVKQPYAKTYVADMSRSFIPDPAVELEADVDRVRLGTWPSHKPLRKAWGRQTTPLVVPEIDQLTRVVERSSSGRITGPLPAGSWLPGEGPALP
jgi:hypothetical protein